MHKVDGKTSGSIYIYKFLLVHAMPFLPWLSLKLHTKCHIWGTLWSQEMGCYDKERNPLLLKCLMTFLRYTKEMGWTSCSIYKLLIVYILPYLLWWTLKLHTKISDCEYPIIVGKRMLRYKERYPLLLKWFVTFFRRIRMVWGDSGSIYKYRIVHIMSFSSRPTIKLHTKFKILGTLHAQEMGPYTVRRGIHRCWSIS